MKAAQKAHLPISVLHTTRTYLVYHLLLSSPNEVELMLVLLLVYLYSQALSISTSSLHTTMIMHSLAVTLLGLTQMGMSLGTWLTTLYLLLSHTLLICLFHHPGVQVSYCSYYYGLDMLLILTY